MAYEDLEIRIGRDGRIYVKIDGVSEERIRGFRQFLEEEIGPVQLHETVRKPDWEQPAARTGEKKLSGEDEIEQGRK